MTLQGSRIVILGGTSGIGLATARAAAAEGARVVVASSRAERVRDALAELPGGAEGHAADLSSEEAVRALFARVGPFDHLVYTAGETLALGEVARTDLGAARDYMGVRLWGAWAAVKHGAPLVRPGGSIVLTSGIVARRPGRGWALGATITAAIEGFTRALAVEVAPVRVNAVSPGVVRTPLWSGMSEDEREAMYATRGASLPVGRVGEAEDLAEAYLFLMRERFATGQVVVVDGGGVLV